MFGWRQKSRRQTRQVRSWASVAAALALLAGAQAAQAALVVRNVNATLVALNLESFDLDLDQNGTTDFTLTTALSNSDPFFTLGFDVVDIPFATSNGVVIDSVSSDGFSDASRLAVGDTVSSASLFSSAQTNLFSFSSFLGGSGNFGGQTGFIGLRFDQSGNTLFGFAQIAVNDINAAVNPLGLTIGTVGFNDVPGQPVQIQVATVPEPGSLALLAAGGLGFLVLRSRRKPATVD